MLSYGGLQCLLYLGCLLLAVKPLGAYMARVYLTDVQLGRRWFSGIERRWYRYCGINPQHDMPWSEYAQALLLFNCLGMLALYALLRLQAYLPLNPQHWPALAPDTAFNLAVSFVSNTNWQSSSPDSSLSYLSQMLGLTVQNFLSAASGMAVLVALCRGFSRRNAQAIGNCWVDISRSCLFILLPLSLLLAPLLVSQGVVQTLAGAVTVSMQTPLNQPAVTQTLALGPAASQIAIKQLGTNGGGFFNANAAHPFENPTPLSNGLEMLAIVLIPAALCYSFGLMIGDVRQSWGLLAVMTTLFSAAVIVTVWAEQSGNPALSALGIDQTASALQAGGNMEGKESRFGISSSALWAVATTATANGSVNATLDAFTPLGGMVALCLMALGEVVFGGVGTGLVGMLVFVLMAVFIAGLMIGRTPAYLGKKIEAFEMKMAALMLLIPPLWVLGGTALSLSIDVGQAALFNPGAHGLSEVLYAFASTANNNGSAFAGISTNTPYYNRLLAAVMLMSRYASMVAALAIAGSLAAKKTLPVGAGSLPTHTPLFALLLLIIVLLVGALTYLPALALGPIVEHLQLSASR
jgi:K+-transporting ATPase ATPase A chain